jgi:hypothetical protein
MVAVERRKNSAPIVNLTAIPNRPIRSLNTVMAELSRLYIFISNKAKPDDYHLLGDDAMWLL